MLTPPRSSRSNVKHACAALCAVLLAAAPLVHATPITVVVNSSDTAAWTRSDGGSGTVIPIGGPAIWSASFLELIPLGATGISFTLDFFLVDDKSVLQLNGTTIADAVVLRPNGTAAGTGTFDFGLGTGTQSYNYTGFTPGAIFDLVDGTTGITLTAFINDTGVVDPSAPPLSVAFTSGFNLSGSLNYTAAVPEAETYAQMVAGLALLAFMQRRRKK